MAEEERQIELTGGSPWGFSIQGGADFRAPLKVTKVSPGGKAALAGVQLNDLLKRIGDKECAALRHSEALFLIRTAGTTLSLSLLKGRAAPAPYQPERHLIRSSTVPSNYRSTRSPSKRASPQKQPPTPPDTSPQDPSPSDTSPSRRESVGGQDWYRAMHRTNTSGEDPRLLSSSGEEKKTKTPPQPIKAKPRSTNLPARSNGSVPFSQPQSLPPQSDTLPLQTDTLPPQSDTLPPQSHTLPPQKDTLPPQKDTVPPQSLPLQKDTVPLRKDSQPSDPTEPVSPGAEGSGRRRSGAKKRRDLKPPPSTNARGLYDFSAETKHELSFQKGAQLRLLRTVDDNWLEAQLGDKKGIIPVSYVELCPAQAEEQDTIAPHAVARYEFLAEESYELGFQKGARVALLSRVDDNWLQGRVEDRTGIFPAAFVDIITPLPEPQAPPTERISAENEIRTHGVPPPESGPVDLYRAVYSYSPQNEDELALEPGTEVHVVRRCEDGWFMGYDGSTGAFGTFPGNYVQPI